MMNNNNNNKNSSNSLVFGRWPQTKKWMALNNPSQPIQKTALMLEEKSQTFFDGTTMLVGMKHWGAFFNTFVFRLKKVLAIFPLDSIFQHFFPLSFGKKADRCQIKFVLKAKDITSKIGLEQSKKRRKAQRNFLSWEFRSSIKSSAVLKMGAKLELFGRMVWMVEMWNSRMGKWHLKSLVESDAFLHEVHSAWADRELTCYLFRINTRDIWMFLCPLWYKKTMTRSIRLQFQEG